MGFRVWSALRGAGVGAEAVHQDGGWRADGGYQSQRDGGENSKRSRFLPLRTRHSPRTGRHPQSPLENALSEMHPQLLQCWGKVLKGSLMSYRKSWSSLQGLDLVGRVLIEGFRMQESLCFFTLWAGGALGSKKSGGAGGPGVQRVSGVRHSDYRVFGF